MTAFYNEDPTRGDSLHPLLYEALQEPNCEEALAHGAAPSYLHYDFCRKDNELNEDVVMPQSKYWFYFFKYLPEFAQKVSDLVKNAKDRPFGCSTDKLKRISDEVEGKGLAELYTSFKSREKWGPLASNLRACATVRQRETTHIDEDYLKFMAKDTGSVVESSYGKSPLIPSSNKKPPPIGWVIPTISSQRPSGMSSPPHSQSQPQFPNVQAQPYPFHSGPPNGMQYGWAAGITGQGTSDARIVPAGSAEEAKQKLQLAIDENPNNKYLQQRKTERENARLARSGSR